MTMVGKLAIATLLLISGCRSAPELRATYPNENADVLHYRFELTLDDNTNVIKGVANLELRIGPALPSEVALNLVGPGAGSSGMIVQDVSFNQTDVSFEHANDLLKIHLPVSVTVNDTITLAVRYSGIPADGLIISTNQYGDRTVFADNWPNRAQHWLPVIDHLADKATCEFLVHAPSRYEVISNGELVSVQERPENITSTHWRTDVVLPTKVMVIGVANFAIHALDTLKGVRFESWSFPQDSANAVHDFSLAMPVFSFFESYIGEYPYKKLANIQSLTRFGGMENASAIFYNQYSITGDRSNEGLIAHEIAHQWFGNSATESDWPHLWLSEGFASYFKILYIEHRYGKERLKTELSTQRERILNAKTDVTGRPVIDTLATDLMTLLNTNSYQKGGAVLHMLRVEVGDSLFQESIRQYYSKFRDKNADSHDFEEVVERVATRELDWFFDQWLRQPGFPVLEVDWHYDEVRKEAVIEIEQTQHIGPVFKFPLLIALELDDTRVQHLVKVTNKTELITLPVAAKPQGVVLDPQCDLLFKNMSNF